MMMASTVPSGKVKGLQALADSRGVIAALAIDQRSALRGLFARAMNADPESVPEEKLIQFKEMVSSALTPYASSILLDPEYGLPAAKSRAKRSGLLLAYEESGYDKNVRGRLPRRLKGWSAQRLVEAGANGVKLLLYYSNVSTVEINAAKYEFVRSVGAECTACDIPFFLELVSYREGLEEKGDAFARVKAEVVSAGIVEFSKPEYRVDILKVGMPVNLNLVQGAPALGGTEFLHNREDAKLHFRRAADLSRVPFIYLSEGVSNPTFQFGLELASEAQVKFSGVLCGRATWKDGVPVFVNGGMSALQGWLVEQGIENIENVNKCLATATPWFSFHGQSTGA
ncbi:MAG: tagatose 1,6-diphosphate aldolase [Candidatus Acidiferrum sp.]